MSFLKILLKKVLFVSTFFGLNDSSETWDVLFQVVLEAVSQEKKLLSIFVPLFLLKCGILLSCFQICKF